MSRFFHAALRLLAAALVLGGVIFVYLNRQFLDPHTIHQIISDSPWAPLIFIGIQVAASLLFVPRSVMGAVAGLLFGMVWGLALAVAGAVAGAAVGFAFVRWLGIGGSLDTAPAIGRLMQRAERGHWRTVAIVRLLPFPHSVANTALAMTRITWRDYLIGSAIGMLPMTVAQVGVGAAGNAIFTSRGGWTLACFILAGAFAVSFLMKRALKNKSEDTAQG